MRLFQRMQHGWRLGVHDNHVTFRDLDHIDEQAIVNIQTISDCTDLTSDAFEDAPSLPWTYSLKCYRPWRRLWRKTWYSEWVTDDSMPAEDGEVVGIRVTYEPMSPDDPTDIQMVAEVSEGDWVGRIRRW